MAKYNGHKNWNAWNVSLWINNDKGLYQQALEAIEYAKRCGTGRVGAAVHFKGRLLECGIRKTPDGAPYSVTTIRAAMVGMT